MEGLLSNIDPNLAVLSGDVLRRLSGPDSKDTDNEFSVRSII